MPTTYKRGLLPDAPDLEAYFRRIGSAGPRTATFDTLAALHLLHPQAIPFENLDTLLRRPIVLSTAALERKMLSGGRGGWCYEHNLLLGGVLEALGFQVTGYAARMLRTMPEGVTLPRTHMLLGVEWGSGEATDFCLADVGLGVMTFTGPLRLISDVEQSTPHGTFRLLETGRGSFVTQALLHGEWQSIYSFDLQPQMLADYEMHNWYLSHFPESVLLNNLMATRAAPGRRYALFNNRFTTHHLGGESDKVMLTSPGELREVLEGAFQIRLPEDPGLEGVLGRIAGM